MLRRRQNRERRNDGETNAGEDYTTLSSEDVTNIPEATLAKYTYMHSYCQYVIANNVNGLGQNFSQEDKDRYLLGGLVCLAALGELR